MNTIRAFILCACFLLGSPNLASCQAGSEATARLHVQRGHHLWAGHLAWSPDSRRLLTASQNDVCLWDAGSGKELANWNYMFTSCAAWNPEGTQVGFAHGDTVTVWDGSTMKDHHLSNGFFNGVAWSPDGRILAAGGWDHDSKNSVWLWDARTGKEIRKMTGHSGSVRSLSFSPNGRILATCSIDRTVRLWDVAGRMECAILRGHSATVWNALWSPDGSALATCGLDQTIRIWDPLTGQARRNLSVPWTWFLMSESAFKRGNDQPDRPDASVAWSPDGRLLASGGGDCNGHIWDVASGRELKVLTGHKHKVCAVAWSPDGHVLATGTGQEAVRLWDVKTGKELRALSQDADGCVLAFSPDGHTLATCPPYSSEGNSVRLWAPATGKIRSLLAGRASFAKGAAWNPASTILAIASNNNILLWDAAMGRARSLTGHTSEVKCLAWSQDGQRLASGGLDGSLRIWDPATCREQQKMVGHTGIVSCLGWSPDGHTLATGDEGTEVHLWDTETGKPVRLLKGHSKYVETLSWSPDGAVIATGSRDGSVRLWDAATGQERYKWADSGDQPWQLKWSPNGRILAGHNGQEKTWLWSAETGKEVHVLGDGQPKGAYVVDMTWSPDGRALATAGTFDANLRVGLQIWDPTTGKLVREFSSGKKMQARCLAWSPDGRVLATGSYDQEVQLWDAATGQPSLLLSGHLGQLENLAWSPDARTLASSSVDCSTRLWDPSTGKELAALMGFGGNASFPDGSWAVVSPEGFFDGSLQGLKQMHWVIGLNPFDLEQFFTEFYQPGLLKDVLEQHKPISQIMREREDSRASLTILKKDRRPVEVAFESTPTQCDQRKLAVTLKLQESGPDLTHKQACGIKDVRLFNNGILVWRSPDGKPVKPGRISLSVPIVAGKNSLTAYAFNRDNVKCRDVTTEVTGAESLKRQGQAWILAIGIDKYANPNYNLNYAGADARELARALGANLPFPDRDKNVHVTTLFDDKATRKGLLDALRQIAKEALLEDTVIVTYAGHGMNYKGRFYLLPHDVGAAKDEEQLSHFGVSDIDLENIFIGMNAGHITLVLDACHSGQALESEEWRVGPMNARGMPQLAWEKGMDILTASQSNETAKEVSKIGHGLLTFALLEGFKNAPRNAGSLAARHWLDFGAAQVPQILGEDREVKAQVARGAGRLLAGARRPLLIQTPRVFHAHEDTLDWMVSGPR